MAAGSLVHLNSASLLRSLSCQLHAVCSGLVLLSKQAMEEAGLLGAGLLGRSGGILGSRGDQLLELALCSTGGHALGRVLRHPAQVRNDYRNRGRSDHLERNVVGQVLQTDMVKSEADRAIAGHMRDHLELQMIVRADVSVTGNAADACEYAVKAPEVRALRPDTHLCTQFRDRELCSALGRAHSRQG